MAPLHLLLFGLISAVLAHSPCIDYRAVCVPAEAMQRGCHCALIRPGQETSARQSLRQMFGRRKRDTDDDFRFAILSQSGVNELNRVFSAAEVINSQNAAHHRTLHCASAEKHLASFDSDESDESHEIAEKRRLEIITLGCREENAVFAWINTQVHSRIMTVPTELLAEVVNLQAQWLPHEARHHLLHCGGPSCSSIGHVTDLLGNPPPTRQDRQFRVVRATRLDLPDDPGTTLLAFASANADFFLHKKLVQWQEKKCRRRWGFKKCRHETRSREELQVFDELKRNKWMDQVNREIISHFRNHHANLLA